MKLSEEIEKVSSDILLEYDKDAPRITDKKFVTGMIDFLARRALKYEIIAKDAELQLLKQCDTDKLFKRIYKQLDKQINHTTKAINKHMPKLEVPFKLALIKGVSEEHEQFVDCFKKFESEANR
jgi:hypothetical protein